MGTTCCGGSSNSTHNVAVFRTVGDLASARKPAGIPGGVRDAVHDRQHRLREKLVLDGLDEEQLGTFRHLDEIRRVDDALDLFVEVMLFEVHHVGRHPAGPQMSA